MGGFFKHKFYARREKMMKIPKDKKDRMKEFVNYHKTGDGECNGILLKAYADLHKMSQQERYDLAYFYSVVYCVPSAIIMLQAKDDILKEPEKWARENTSRIIFQSDRRYVRTNGNFEKMLREYANKNCDADAYISETVRGGHRIDLEKAVEKTQEWYFYGRFGAFLFVETLCLLMGYEGTNVKIIWKDGDTATSGLLNLFCLDNSADYFDKNDKLPPQLKEEELDDMFRITLKEIQRAGGETNVTEVETSLCAYRKFYKGSRYNGYYLDRQLQEINMYMNDASCKTMCQELFMLRKRHFDRAYLGELNGWKGVRKDCKTLYKRTGRMM